jgi:hypothetical protein
MEQQQPVNHASSLVYGQPNLHSPQMLPCLDCGKTANERINYGSQRPLVFDCPSVTSYLQQQPSPQPGHLAAQKHVGQKAAAYQRPDEGDSNKPGEEFGTR